MSDWRDLSEEEWRAHPLNRVRGWILFIFAFCLAFALIDLLELTLLILWPNLLPDLTSSDFGGTAWIGVASLFIYLACMAAILRRWRHTATLFVIALISLAGIEFWFFETWSGDVEGVAENWIFEDAVYLALSLAMDIALILYLFFSARANVLFRRRVRLPS